MRTKYFTKSDSWLIKVWGLKNGKLIYFSRIHEEWFPSTLDSFSHLIPISFKKARQLERAAFKQK